MQMNELWEKACELLREEINTIAFNTFISNNVIPVRLEEDTLVLRIVADMLKNYISDTYRDKFASALSQAAGHRMKVKIVTAAELEKEQERVREVVPHAAGSVMLNPKYNFDSFIVGNNNRLAHAAALAVAEAPGCSLSSNPLFIYGGVGLGKTHLMHAIGHDVMDRFPEKRLLYISSEKFTTELVAAIQQNNSAEFRQRYRNVDVLMVDDIQFIAGRETTQEEFFHTFNELRENGKQIVLTSDRPPKDIQRLEERLQSRFGWGLTVDIGKPDFDTRIAILTAKAQHEHVDVPKEVIEMIARSVDTNIRDLEGSLNRLIAYAGLMKISITMEVAQAALHDMLEKKNQRVINAESITKAVCSFYSLTPEDLTGPSRRRDVTMPRQIAMYLIREMTSMSLPQIGAAFGKRDHTTVLHACKLVEESLRTSPDIARQVGDLRHMVQGS